MSFLRICLLHGLSYPELNNLKYVKLLMHWNWSPYDQSRSTCEPVWLEGRFAAGHTQQCLLRGANVLQENMQHMLQQLSVCRYTNRPTATSTAVWRWPCVASASPAAATDYGCVASASAAAVADYGCVLHLHQLQLQRTMAVCCICISCSCSGLCPLAAS
jgi:hypothetical protein